MIQLTSIPVALLLGIICIPLFLFLRKRFGPHPLDKIPGPRSTSWWNGHYEEVFGSKRKDFHLMMGEKYGPTASFRTVYGERQLYTFDPKAMHHIFVKDQMIYGETSAFLDTNYLMFGNGLLATSGQHHRKQRKILNPVFSIAHMRNMLPTFYEVAHKLQDTLAKKVQNGPQEIDMLSWMARTALELIGQSGLGYSFDELEDEEHAHPYVKTLKGLAPLLTRAFFMRNYILPYAMQLGTPGFRRFVSQFLPWKDFQNGRQMSSFLWKLSTGIYEEKKRALEMGDEAVKKQIGGGNDILSILMNENMKASESDRLDEEELIGQMSTLIFAAMDTTSTALSRILQLLATHPEVQQKLRDEIDEAFQDGDIPYDVLVSLPYLDAISRESLRLHPPVHRLMRTTLQDAILPLSTPVTTTDGSVLTEIVMPKNTDVFVSILNANRNPAIWGPDADQWKPKRWLEPLPKTVTDAKVPGVYSHLMTFNAGGRSCIGFKFSQLEMKVVLSLLIRTFEFSLTGKEISWQMTGVASPLVVGPEASRHPEMPMKVSLVKRK
ncbi:cytochrome p450 [Moniliophthora roreri]|nr:cytochrome p450 [Moniliophthora roreri]